MNHMDPQSFTKKTTRRMKKRAVGAFLFRYLPPIPKLGIKGAKWLPYNLDLLLPSIVLGVLATIFLLLTVHKVINVVSSLSSLPSVTGTSGTEVRRLYLDKKEYLEYSPTLSRLNPGVVFSVNEADGSMLLTIGNEELFPDLMMAMHTMQSFRPGVAWEMVEMCVRTCPDKAVARVAVKGFKQEIR
jgi:hypothetical protein